MPLKPALLALSLAGPLLLGACRSGPKQQSAPPHSNAAAAEPVLAVPPDSITSADSKIDTLALDSTPQDPQVQLELPGRLIDSLFRHMLGESPRMGWWARGRFLARERHPRLYIWSAEPDIITASYVGALSSAEHARLTREAHVACEIEGPLGQYGAPMPPSPRMVRAFYSSSPPPSGTRVGFVARSLTTAERTAAHLLIAAAGSVTYADTAFAPIVGATSYSIVAAYHTDGSLVRSALVLHDSSGAIVASQVDSAEAFMCDGCGPPTVADGYRALYDIRNAFVVPGFPYPILLLDTSTIEGRALSLITYIPPGAALAHYRIYEYVVECILQDGR